MAYIEKKDCKHYLDDNDNPLGWCAKYNGETMCKRCKYYKKKEVQNESLEQEEEA